MEVPILKDILRAMNIKQVELEGFEADDLIGTIAKEAESCGMEPLIITGDKDELQLATDITKIILTPQGGFRVRSVRPAGHDGQVRLHADSVHRL